MIELLSRLFVKNYKSYDNENVRKSYGTLASVVGVITNFILASMKLVIGIIASSVAITADALNNLSDAGSSVITFMSFKISSKPADKDHPFGHARMEYICSMIVSFLILLVGAELLFDSGKTLLGLKESEKTEISLITIIILSVSILLKLWLGLFNYKVGKKINSGVIKATAMDSITDSISTLAVLISAIVIKFTDFQLLDSIVGIAVSCLIIYAGIKILLETKDAILGEAPVDEVVEGIKKIVDSYEEIIDIHDLMVHNYGPKRFIASFHAEVDGTKDIYMLHDMIDNAERQIKEELGISCTIHMDPIVTDEPQVLELKSFLTETLSEAGLQVNYHDFRVVVGETHTNLIFDVVLPFDSEFTEKDIIDKISSLVHAKRSNCYCVITVDRG
ncbi:MAG: cation transporter [Clostridia bacterium]|nr:cation transporter [Clostridia bacterium]